MKKIKLTVSTSSFEIILLPRYVVDQLRQYKNGEITQWSQSFLKVAFVFYPTLLVSCSEYPRDKPFLLKMVSYPKKIY